MYTRALVYSQGLQVWKWYLLWGLKSIHRTYFGLFGALGIVLVVAIWQGFGRVLKKAKEAICQGFCRVAHVLLQGFRRFSMGVDRGFTGFAAPACFFDFSGFRAEGC